MLYYDEAGNLVDAEGYLVDEYGTRLPGQAPLLYTDEAGNLVDAEGNRVDEFGNPLAPTPAAAAAAAAPPPPAAASPPPAAAPPAAAAEAPELFYDAAGNLVDAEGFLVDEYGTRLPGQEEAPMLYYDEAGNLVDAEGNLVDEFGNPLAAAPAAGAAGFAVNDPVLAVFADDGQYYNATITSVNPDGTYQVLYTEYGVSAVVAATDVAPPS